MSFNDVIQIGTLLTTTVGFLLLYTTLKLQANIFSEQQSITKLEQEKFRLQIRPVFIKKKSSKFSIRKFEGDANVEFWIELINNTAISVSIESNTEHLIDLFHPFNVLVVQVNESIQIIKGALTYEQIKKPITVIITYQDELLNMYVQMLTGSITHAQLTPPVLVTKEGMERVLNEIKH